VAAGKSLLQLEHIYSG